jgi:hypothetical protein
VVTLKTAAVGGETTTSVANSGDGNGNGTDPEGISFAG